MLHQIKLKLVMLCKTCLKWAQDTNTKEIVETSAVFLLTRIS